MFFRFVKQTKKEKVKEALEIMKKEYAVIGNQRACKTKYTLHLPATNFSKDRDHILRVFEVYTYFTYYIVNLLNLTVHVWNVVTHYLLFLLLQVFLITLLC